MTEKKKGKKPCKNCGKDLTPDKQLAEIKRKTMSKLAELFELKSNEGCLEAILKLVDANAKMILMLAEMEYYVSLFEQLEKLDRDVLKRAIEDQEKPPYVS